MKRDRKPEGSAVQTMTMEQAREWVHSESGKKELKCAATLAETPVDTSDIPEVVALDGWQRNPLYRPVTQSITIRLNAPDVAMARQLSKMKGLPYQTYIKMLLHEALRREAGG